MLCQGALRLVLLGMLAGGGEARDDWPEDLERIVPRQILETCWGVLKKGLPGTRFHPEGIKQDLTSPELEMARQYYCCATQFIDSFVENFDIVKKLMYNPTGAYDPALLSATSLPVPLEPHDDSSFSTKAKLEYRIILAKLSATKKIMQPAGLTDDFWDLSTTEQLLSAARFYHSYKQLEGPILAITSTDNLFRNREHLEQSDPADVESFFTQLYGTFRTRIRFFFSDLSFFIQNSVNTPLCSRLLTLAFGINLIDGAFIKQPRGKLIYLYLPKPHPDLIAMLGDSASHHHILDTIHHQQQQCFDELCLDAYKFFFENIKYRLCGQFANPMYSSNPIHQYDSLHQQLYEFHKVQSECRFEEKQVCVPIYSTLLGRLDPNLVPEDMATHRETLRIAVEEFIDVFLPSVKGMCEQLSLPAQDQSVPERYLMEGLLMFWWDVWKYAGMLDLLLKTLVVIRDPLLRLMAAEEVCGPIIAALIKLRELDLRIEAFSEAYLEALPPIEAKLGLCEPSPIQSIRALILTRPRIFMAPYRLFEDTAPVVRVKSAAKGIIPPGEECHERSKMKKALPKAKRPKTDEPRGRHAPWTTEQYTSPSGISIPTM